MKKHNWGIALCGALAGTVTGLFGGGGGMILVPALSLHPQMDEDTLFPSSVAIILPICITSLVLSGSPLPLANAMPYLLGSCAGGVLAGIFAGKIPTKWLHRTLGIMLLWGGIRYLC